MATTHGEPRERPGGGPPDPTHDGVVEVLAGLGLDLYDLTMGGAGARVLRVLVDRPGGVDLEAVTEATRAVSAFLDRADPVAGTYTLEVSSPGLERPLRLPRHFRAAVGETVSVKYRDAEGRGRRIHGRLVTAGDTGITVEVPGESGAAVRHDLDHRAITQARTVFEWGPPPRPARQARSGRAAQRTGSNR